MNKLIAISAFICGAFFAYTPQKFGRHYWLAPLCIAAGFWFGWVMRKYHGKDDL